MLARKLIFFQTQNQSSVELDVAIAMFTLVSKDEILLFIKCGYIHAFLKKKKNNGPMLLLFCRIVKYPSIGI